MLTHTTECGTYHVIMAQKNTTKHKKTPKKTKIKRIPISKKTQNKTKKNKNTNLKL